MTDHNERATSLILEYQETVAKQAHEIKRLQSELDEANALIEKLTLDGTHAARGNPSWIEQLKGTGRFDAIVDFDMMPTIIENTPTRTVINARSNMVFFKFSVECYKSYLKQKEQGSVSWHIEGDIVNDGMIIVRTITGIPF